jgi:glycosyltransferase involved in cell wall biosynthesis
MKVALVCDSMSAYGGAERVIEQILAVFPSADVFAVVDVLPKGQRAFLGGRTVQTSFLQRVPGIQRSYRKLFPLWAMAVEQLDVTGYDLVISSHHSVAYGVLTRPGQVHVSYVHSPMRYAWDLQHQYLKEAGLARGLLSFIARNALHRARMWDFVAAQRPDAVATNSAFIAGRLWHTHRRRSSVIHPPVAVRPTVGAEKEDYYLSLGRLVPYKRTDLLARAFAAMPEKRLKIVGTGPDLKRIEALRTPNVEVLGFQPDEAVAKLLAGARAFLFGGIEDFGISAVEAQAAGTPVIAYRGGGLLETVRGLEQSSPTGVFFEEQSVPAIIAAVGRFEKNQHLIRAEACVANASRFGEHRFRQEFARFVENALNERDHIPSPALPAAPVEAEWTANVGTRAVSAKRVDLASVPGSPA